MKIKENDKLLLRNWKQMDLNSNFLKLKIMLKSTARISKLEIIKGLQSKLCSDQRKNCKKSQSSLTQ